MRKNCQLHFWIESDLLEKLKKESDETNINLPELCRRKLKSSPRLDRLEFMINRFERLIKVSQQGSRSKQVSRWTSFIKPEDYDETYANV